MPIIYHKFRGHVVNVNTEILMLGTFNPDVPEGPSFFYGRPKNYLWQLLPGCWALPSLKNAPLQMKQNFMLEHHIDFADVIHAVNVPENQVNNINDAYIDGHVHQWKNVDALINALPNLTAVYFTRITLDDIPNIHGHIDGLQTLCNERGIRFGFLVSPSRYYNYEKQQQWIDVIIN